MERSRLAGHALNRPQSDKISKKKRLQVGGPQSPLSISSSFILFLALLPFFLKTKIYASKLRPAWIRTGIDEELLFLTH